MTTELNKMETKPILPLIFNMSLPPLFSMFMQYTYNFVDCIFVSWISEDALTAVSLSFPLTTLMLAFSIGTVIAIIMMGAGVLLLSVFPAQILNIFMASDDMLDLGIPALRIMATSYVFNGFATMAASYMQSIGKIRHSVLINLMRQLIALLACMWLFTRLIGMTGVWLAFPVAEIITCILSVYILKNNPVADK